MNNPASHNVPLLELQREHCREVTGTGEDGLALYCGHRRSGLTSYCAFHRRINLVMVTSRPQHSAPLSTEVKDNEKKKVEESHHVGVRP